MPTLADVMTRDPIVVHEDTPLADCIGLLKTHAIRHLPVVDGDGVLLGIANDYAILGPHNSAEPVSHVMTSVAVTARPGDDLLVVLHRTAFSLQDAVVVVDPELRPVGVLTEHDAVRMSAASLGSELSVGDYASTTLVTAQRSDLAADVLARMTERFLRHVIVLDGDRLYGVVSYRDLMRAGVRSGMGTRVDDLPLATPSQDLVTAGERLALRDAAARMVTHHIGCLPIVDDGWRPYAVLTRTDLIRALKTSEAVNQ